MEGEPYQKVYYKRKHPKDVRDGKSPKSRPIFCFICRDLYCKRMWGEDTPIPGSGLEGYWKKTKHLGRKEEAEKKRYQSIIINQEIQHRNELED